MLELKGENPFKTRAYANAARALEALTESLDKLIAENQPAITAILREYSVPLLNERGETID